MHPRTTNSTASPISFQPKPQVASMSWARRGNCCQSGMVACWCNRTGYAWSFLISPHSPRCSLSRESCHVFPCHSVSRPSCTIAYTRSGCPSSRHFLVWCATLLQTYLRTVLLIPSHSPSARSSPISTPLCPLVSSSNKRCYFAPFLPFAGTPSFTGGIRYQWENYS